MEKDCRMVNIHLPIMERSVSMWEVMYGAEQRAAMERIGAQIQACLAQMSLKGRLQSQTGEKTEIKRRIEFIKRYWLDERQLLREGVTPWQIMNRHIPIELRTAQNQ